MPLLLEARVGKRIEPGGPEAPPHDRRRPQGQWTPSLEIGLLNNMPDAALKATEAQFIRLLGDATGDRVVRLHLFGLPDVPRGPSARAHMRARYADLATLWSGRLDALIVTGSEPKAARLVDEPYWKSFTEVVDWAEGNTISTIWSCLAAHAAVLHLDGIARRRLPQKRFGLFGCTPVDPAHPFVGSLGRHFAAPHSRWNDLDEGELVAHGYRVLARSPEAGVDTFSKQWNSLFLFFQGHPEYDRDTLFREYRRDMTRFLRGERDTPPGLPVGYFDASAAAALEAYAERAAGRRAPDAVAKLPADHGLNEAAVAAWQPAAIGIYRNWLDHVAAVKADSTTGRAA